MCEIGHRLKSSRPKTEGVDGEMQQKEHAENESSDGEIMARADMAAARAAVLLFRRGKIQRQQFTGRKIWVMPGMATAAALTAIAQRKFFRSDHALAAFLPQVQFGRAGPV